MKVPIVSSLGTMRTERDMDPKKLKTLLEIGRQMAETRELDLLLASAMNLALEFLGAEYGYIVLLNGKELVFKVGQDKQGNQLQEPREQISRTIFDKVIQNRKGVIIEDALDSFDTSSVIDLQLRSVMCVPLMARGKILGAIYVENRSVSSLFEKDDFELLEYFAAQTAVAIENAILNQDLEARVEARTAELALANAELQRLATIDPLTGVFNRRHFFNTAKTELERARRHGYPTSIIMLDLDHFKQINDQHGHLVGDLVLQAATQYILSNIRTIDILGRLGGEEFAILLPDTSLSNTKEIADRICSVIASQPVPAGNKMISISASLGVTSVEGMVATGVDMLLDQADQALYAAKHAGRNKVVIWADTKVP